MNQRTHPKKQLAKGTPTTELLKGICCDSIAVLGSGKTADNIVTDEEPRIAPAARQAHGRRGCSAVAARRRSAPEREVAARHPRVHSSSCPGEHAYAMYAGAIGVWLLCLVVL